MGKTTLAKLIVHELKTKIHIFYASNFHKPSDLFSHFTKIKDNEIVFIDEIYCLKKELEEYMFQILDNQNLQILIGKNYNSKTINVKLQNFTFIIATTELHKISEQFFNRFPIFFSLENYKLYDIIKIIMNIFKKYNLSISESAANLLSTNTKFNPRLTINLLKRIYDYCIVEKINFIDGNILNKLLRKMRIYENGINDIDKKYLIILKKAPLLLKSIHQFTNFSDQYDY